MKPFFMYMLECSDDSYYIGHTDDIDKRIFEHMQGHVSGYTKTRLPIKVVYVQDFMTRDEAINVEQQIKGWCRQKKEALIKDDWETIKKLSNK
jgi:tRNA/rRNA methyltransferase